MQCIHGPLKLTFNHIRHHVQRITNSVIYLTTILFRGFSQHVVNNLIPVPGMTDAHSHTIEILAAQMADQITQTIMATMTTALFQPDGTRRQIQLIVNNQNLLQRNFKKPRQRTDCLAAAVHKSHWFLQAALVAVQQTARYLAVEPLFQTEALPATLYQFIDKPKPGVMPGWFVFRTGVAQSDDKLNSRHRPAGSAFAFSGCFTAVGRFTLFNLATTATYMDRYDRQIVPFTTCQFNQAATFWQREI